MNGRFATRVEPLDPGEPHLDSVRVGLRVRARFDVLLRGSWVGVLHLGARDHWYLLTGACWSRDQRDLLELNPDRVDFLGPDLKPAFLERVAERRLRRMQAARAHAAEVTA